MAIAFIALIFLAHLYVNIRLSLDVFGWVPEARKRRTYLCLVWLLPLAGAFYVYRRLAPEWFTPDGATDDIQTVAAAGLLGLDGVFNPGSRNIAEIDKKGELTVKAEGEMYHADLPEFIDVEAERTQMQDTDS